MDKLGTLLKSTFNSRRNMKSNAYATPPGVNASGGTPRQKAIRIADELGVEVVVVWEDVRIDVIELYSPDGYNWEGDRHSSCAVQRDGDPNLLASSMWKGVIKELEIPLEKCPEDCVCKE